jgi:hypothetical protein
MPADEQEVTARPSERKRADDFSSHYANNVFLEASAWDLKCIFGQLDQNLDPNKEIVLQHSSITLPWAQVKMLAYLLQVHLAMHENRTGKVMVPQGLIFKVKGDMPADFQQQFRENTEALWQKLRSLYDAFIEENPEAE